MYQSVAPVTFPIRRKKKGAAKGIMSVTIRSLFCHVSVIKNQAPVIKYHRAFSTVFKTLYLTCWFISLLYFLPFVCVHVFIFGGFLFSLFFFLIKLLKPFAKSMHNPSKENTNVRHPSRRIPFTRSSFLHTPRVHLGLLYITMEHWLLSHSSL